MKKEYDFSNAEQGTSRGSDLNIQQSAGINIRLEGDVVDLLTNPTHMPIRLTFPLKCNTSQSITSTEVRI